MTDVDFSVLTAIIIYLSGLVLGAIAMGIFDEDTGMDRDSIIFALIIWPLTIMLLIVVYTFLFLFHTGKYIRRIYEKIREKK